MDNKSKKFRLIAERLKRKLLLKTDKDLAEKIGLKPKAFNARKQVGSIPYPEILDLASRHNLDLNDLLSGDVPNSNDATQAGSIYKDKDLKNEVSEQTSDSPNPSSQNGNLIVIEHQDIIRRFKDPEKAKEFNEFLVEIEEDDPQGYDELYKEARAIAKTIKRLRHKKNTQEGNNGIAVNGE